MNSGPRSRIGREGHPSCGSKSQEMGASAANTQLDGAVLAGGRSTRMGRNKALLLVEGVSLWKRQVRVLEAAGVRDVALVLRPRQRSLGERNREIRDSAHHEGPLAGLHAALKKSKGEWLAVLAVDMPLVDAEWFRGLRRRCRAGKGAVVRSPRGFEPLAAIYPRAAMEVVDRRLRSGWFALQGLVRELVGRRQMSVVSLRASERWRAANWNTPADVLSAPAPLRQRRARTS